MSKFERVLSDEEVDNIVKNTTILLGRSIARSKDFILRVEQAVLAKLAEQQEPVAWYVPENEYIRSNFTGDNHMAMSYEYRGVNVKPLYAHPMPSVSPTSDKTACVSEIAESDIQRHLDYIKRYQKWRRGEDKTMSEAGINPKQLGGSLDWLIAFAENHIADASKMVGSDHIPDIGQMIPDGWQLVPKEPTPEMIQAATSSDEEYSKRSFGGGVHLCQGGYDHYLVMLAAAPKYTGEK